MTIEGLFRSAIGWAATYSDAAMSMEDWDRIAAAKAKEFARLAGDLTPPATKSEVPMGRAAWAAAGLGGDPA